MRSIRLLALLTPLVVAGCGKAPSKVGNCPSGSGSALTVCPAGPVLYGVDVSTYQSTINWTSAKAAGIDYAIARISDGLNYPDNQFAANWPHMKAAGVIRGTYQFFRPGQDPTAQANYVLTTLAANGGLEATDLPVVMDMEVTDSQSDATIRAHMTTWLNAIQAGTGRVPMIYTANFMSSHVGTGFSAYPLWVANYTSGCPLIPAGWSHWEIWQNTDDGGVSGIPGRVDGDMFNGTAADLSAFINGSPAPDAGPVPDAGTAGSCGVNGGHYCGGDGVNGVLGTLYVCQGNVAVVDQVCAYGCEYQPTGVPDNCYPAPADGGALDAGHPAADAGPGDAGPVSVDAGEPADAGSSPADAGYQGQTLGSGTPPACH